MRVFVTGATGLVGSHVVELLRAKGHDVVALRRRSSDTSWLRKLGCGPFEGDVRDSADDLAAGMRGCTHLVHAAALVYSGGSWPKVRAVNVEGTRHVLEAAAAAGVAHAVHVSSVAVYGKREGSLDETTSFDTELEPSDLYGRSKREAEAEAREVESARGLKVTIVRPAAVYGERDRLMAPAVARIVRRPVAAMLGRGCNTLPVVYAGNVAAALLLALEAGRGGATYDLAMDHPITQRQLLEGIARGMGRVPILVPIPAPLVRAGAALLGRLGVAAPGASDLPLSKAVRIALGENPYRSVRARRELGWDPPHRHEEALVRTGRWVKEHP